MLLFFSTLFLQAQDVFILNDYGAYVVDAGRLIETPIKRNTHPHAFINNHVIFWYSFIGAFAIFNIENGTVIEIWDDLLTGNLIILDDDDYLAIAYGGYITRFDFNTLEIIERIYGGEEYYVRSVFKPEWINAEAIRIEDRTMRYISGSNYIDILFGPEINITRIRDIIVVYHAESNRFAISANIFSDDK